MGAIAVATNFLILVVNWNICDESAKFGRAIRLDWHRDEFQFFFSSLFVPPRNGNRRVSNKVSICEPFKKSMLWSKSATTFSLPYLQVGPAVCLSGLVAYIY